MTAPIQDLRDAIALLQQHDNQYLETDHPVDPNAELAGVYRHIGAGGTVKRPTRIGPAMMFNNIKGYPHSRILVGMHASRQRAALLLGCEASQLALEVGKAVKKPVAPVVVPASSAPCRMRSNSRELNCSTSGINNDSRIARVRVPSMTCRRPWRSASLAQISREAARPAVQPARVQLAERELTEKTSAIRGNRGWVW